MKKWKELPRIRGVLQKKNGCGMAAGALLMLMGLFHLAMYVLFYVLGFDVSSFAFRFPTVGMFLENILRSSYLNPAFDLLLILSGTFLFVGQLMPLLGYRCALVLLALAGYSAGGSFSAVALVAALLFVTSFGLRTNVMLKNGPAILRKPYWNTVITLFAALLLGSRVWSMVSSWFTTVARVLEAGNGLGMAIKGILRTLLAPVYLMLPFIAVFLLCLAVRGEEAVRENKPRWQSVPAEGGKLLRSGALLLAVYMIICVVSEVGGPMAREVAGVDPNGASALSYFAGGLWQLGLGGVLRLLVVVLPGIVGVSLLLGQETGKKHYLAGIFLVNLYFVGSFFYENISSEVIVPSLVWVMPEISLVVLLWGALGLPGNKKLGKLPITSLLALLLSGLGAALLLFAGVVGFLNLVLDWGEPFFATLLATLKSMASPLIFMLGVILIALSLTAKPAPAVTRVSFKSILNWCYTNVGGKLQKCMKVLGGVYIVCGVIFVGCMAVGVMLFFKGNITEGLTVIALGFGGLLLSVLYVIFTYPLFGFAQMTSDVRKISDGGVIAVKAEEPKAAPVAAPKAAPKAVPMAEVEKPKAAPAAPAAVPEAPKAAPEAPKAVPAAEDFNPDELPDL